MLSSRGLLPIVYISHNPWERNTPVNVSAKNLWFGGYRRDETRPAPANYVYLGQRGVLRNMVRLLRKSGAGVLVFGGAHSLNAWTSIAVLRWNAVRWRLPVVVYWHETAVEMRALNGSEPHPSAARLVRRLRFRLMKQPLSGARAWHLAPSSQCKQLLMYAFGVIPERIHVVHEAMRHEEITPREGRCARRPSRFCMAGVPNWRKGRDIFKQVALTYGAVDEYACFTWYGGETEACAQATERIRQIADRDDLLQFRAYGVDFRRALASEDVFLLTSRDDPFPLVALEALAADLPVFCFDTTGIAEIVPREFVCRDKLDMQEKMARYVQAFDYYPEGFFRAIALQFDEERAMRRWGAVAEDIRSHE